MNLDVPSLDYLMSGGDISIISMEGYGTGAGSRAWAADLSFGALCGAHGKSRPSQSETLYNIVEIRHGCNVAFTEFLTDITVGLVAFFDVLNHPDMSILIIPCVGSTFCFLKSLVAPCDDSSTITVSG